MSAQRNDSNKVSAKLDELSVNPEHNFYSDQLEDHLVGAESKFPDLLTMLSTNFQTCCFFPEVPIQIVSIVHPINKRLH